MTHRTTHTRYLILTLLFAVTAFSYGDRVVLSIAGVAFAHDLHLNPLQVGYLFSAFSWAYALAQLPSGQLLDRFGVKRVYGIAILAWSLCALLIGFAGFLTGALAFTVIFALRLLSGLAQSPVFPGNGRVVAAWFPTAERGFASAVFNSSQYFSLVLFAPVMAAILHRTSWRACFWVLGTLGFGLAVLWFRGIHNVVSHPRIAPAEVAVIEQGGGLLVIGASPIAAGFLNPALIGRLLANRMLLGIYLGQYCIVTLTWFFLTWFPIYLSQARHMSLAKVGWFSALPALCGFLGGLSGGYLSDRLIRAGHTVNFARKLPIILGMTLAITLVLCNFVDSQTAIVALLSLAFFGKGFGALGWSVIADTSPKGMIGLNGGLFNLIGNLAGITTPIVIGYLVLKTGNFREALVFVAASALLAILSYAFLTGDIHRLDPKIFTQPTPTPR